MSLTFFLLVTSLLLSFIICHFSLLSCICCSTDFVFVTTSNDNPTTSIPFETTIELSTTFTTSDHQTANATSESTSDGSSTTILEDTVSGDAVVSWSNRDLN